ncbi:MAG: phage head closure protein [Hydrogenophilaceae bacterium]|jgi:SPP1 family predicted phage head-tail adaptor|nr:phage head closure protein [Hydrogenophilaceae bacterium]
MTEVPGGLRARVTLQSPTRTSDDLGGAILGWTHQGDAWARIEAAGGGRAAALDGEATRVRWRVALRAPSSAAVGWRILWNGRALRVLTVAPAEPGLLTLDCEEETL